VTRQEALRLLEETLEMKRGSLQGGEDLRDLEAWDSLATMAFIAEVDKRLGLPLPPGRVARCQTTDDLLDLLAPRPSAAA